VDELTQATNHIGSAARNLRITDVHTLTFRFPSRVGRDDYGHAHPVPEHNRLQTVTRIRTNAGVEGFAIGGTPQTAAVARRLITGMNPFEREAIWTRLQHTQRLERQAMTDRHLCAIDLAVWDLCGRLTGLPVYRLLGGYRDSVPAYASTMLGDDIEGGLATPADYAAFARDCQARGYPAFKLHTWQAPYGPDIKQDIAACRAVREAVGPDMKLMLDPNHTYTREETLVLGRALEDLDFYWLEEPMNEYSVSAYIWLADQLRLPICGPETAEGQHYTRAEWIVRRAADISRAGVWDVGGITPTMKIVHLCEAFHMRCEIHGGGAGNLHVLGAMAIPGEFYEHGLLHPHLDFDREKPWLKSVIDPVDAHGNVPIPQAPGLGEDLDWDFIHAHTVTDWS
jgi:L-alanine-DL-glutamate epimerase-like enolase superfamily enzyme